MSRRGWLDRVPHDLRGPLSSLQTAAYLLRSDPQAANAQELAGIVVRQSQRMARMIEELDDCVRADQGRLVDRREPQELAQLVDVALTGVPDCPLEPVYADDARDLRVCGDEARLTQLLRILVAQAQARDPGGARLRVSREDDVAVVRVCDRGPAVDDCDGLLQGAQHPAPDQGLGLRLLVARAIAEAHGGQLVARPGADGGLELQCRLPLA